MFRFLLLLLAVAAAYAQTSGDWPQFRFDSARSGANPAETILSGSSVGGLSEGKVFIGAHDQLVGVFGL